MSTDSALGDCVDIIVAWAKRETTRLRRPPRQNVRLMIQNPELACAVRERLELSSGPSAWYVVRASGDSDAVTQRHGRPETRPSGVSETTPLLYLLFWTPGLRTEGGSHDANAQSLADLDTLKVGELLGDAKSITLPVETRVTAQSTAAVDSLPEARRALVGRYLDAAWNALHSVIREKAGGRERSLPFVTQLEDYVAFVRAAIVPEEVWASTLPAERAALVVRTWGEALPALDMFKIPALGDLLGLPLAADAKAPRKGHDELFERNILNMLAENLDAASDHYELAEKLSGKASLAERMEKLPVGLAQNDPDGAARSLYEFCTGTSNTAFSKVEWLFRSKETGKKRPESQGLKGLLIQRGAKQRRDPIERAVTETTAFLAAALEPSTEAVDAAAKLVALRGFDAQANSRTAQRMASELTTLAQGQSPQSVTDPTLRYALDEAVRAGKLAVAMCESLARTWKNLAGDDAPTVRREQSLLLGIVRALGANSEVSAAGGSVVLGIVAADGKKLGAEHVVNFLANGREELRQWFRDALSKLEVPVEDDGEGDEDAFPEEAEEDRESPASASVRIEVSIRKQGETTSVAAFDLEWSERIAALLDTVRRDTIRHWSLMQRSGRRVRNEVGELFSTDGTPLVSLPPAYAEAWFKLHAAMGAQDHAALAASFGPLPANEVRGFVDTWCALLGRAGHAGGKSAHDLLVEEISQASASGDMARVAQLVPQLSRPAPPNESLSQDAVRTCLSAMTGVIESADKERRLYLTPFHPLVLRLRLLEEDVLWNCAGAITSAVATELSQRAVSDALDGWGLPEPCSVYGGYWEGDPLAFDNWTRERFARFVPHRPAVATDLDKLGIEAGRRTVERYLSLHPAARDRLSIRVQADGDGRWAWRLVTAVLESEEATIDLSLITPRGLREPTFFERGAHTSEQAGALDMADDGTPPRVRLRREGSDPVLVHVATCVGTSASVFVPKLETIHVGDDEVLQTWSPQRLFDTSQWEAVGNGLVAGRPRFQLELNVARAISFGARGGSDIFIERISIDPTVVCDPIRKLHRHAHWLAVVTRHPVHRVIESAGDDVAMLLDFKVGRDAGRPLYTCTSMGRDQFEFDLRRLREVLSRILGKDALSTTAERLVHAARRFAPGTAISCTGASGTTYVQGLIGLLLSCRTAPNGVDRATLPLDQHASLLSRGTSGMRSDILLIERLPDQIRLRVLESKVTSNEPMAVREHAAEQIRHTCAKLEHLTHLHPLALRVREDLARAVDVQAEISGDGSIRAIARAIRNESLPITVAAVAEHEVHVWALGNQVALTTADADSPRFIVHARTELLRALNAL